MKTLFMFGLALLLSSSLLLAQSPNSDAGEVGRLFGLEPDMKALHALELSRGQGPVTLEELVLRQQLTEEISAAVLDVDSVIAELSNEQSDLETVKTEL